MHPFALAQVFRSEEFKKADPAVDVLEVVEQFSDNAQVFYTSSCSDPPMPKSDQVFASAFREPAEGGPLLVAEWAVSHPARPERDRKVRQYPFTVASFAQT